MKRLVGLFFALLLCLGGVLWLRRQSELAQRAAPGLVPGDGEYAPTTRDVEPALERPADQSARRDATPQNTAQFDAPVVPATAVALPTDEELESRFGSLDKAELHAAFALREHWVSHYSPGTPVDDGGEKMTEEAFAAICREYSFLKTKVAQR